MNEIQSDIEDLPLMDATDVDQDLPLDTEGFDVRSRPKQVDEMHRGHAAVIKADVDSTDVFTAYQGLDVSGDAKAQVSQLAIAKHQSDQRALTDYFNQNLGDTPEEVTENVEIYREMVAEDAANNTPERQVVSSFAGMSPDAQEAARAQAELELINVITDISSDYSTLEKVMDVGKAFLPTGIIDNKQVADSFFGAESFMRDVVIGMKDLRRNDPEKFSRILPVLVEELQEDLPKGKQLEVLSAILNPRGEEELGSFSAVGAALDTLDVATLGLAAASKVAKLVKSQNAIKLAARLDNVELASEVNTAAVVDTTGEVALRTGIDEVTAHANSAPFNVSDLDDAYASGLSTETLTNISKVRAEQKKVSEIIRKGDGLLKENLLTPAERLVAEDKFADTLRAEGIDNFEVASRTDTGTTFKYQVATEDGAQTYATRTFDLSVDDVTGVWKRTDKGMTASYLKSPTAFAKWAEGDVNAAIRMDSTSANIGKLFGKLQQEAMQPIIGKSGMRAYSIKGRRELAELDDVLRAGDEWKDPSGVRGKVFTVDELRGGLVNGIRLNDKQIETYYNVRGLYDELWTIRNDEARATAVLQGKKEVNLAGIPQVGKPLTREGATASLNQSGSLKVYHAELDEVIQVSGNNVASLYDEGYTFSKLESPIKAPTGNHGDELYDVVITGNQAIKELPLKYLSYRQGYVPKVNKGAYWFIKQIGTRNVNGQTLTNQILKTERMFASRTEADKWLNGQIKSVTESTTMSEVEKTTRLRELQSMKVLPDRAVEQETLGSSQIGSGGGLYTGARASEDIPFGVEGTIGERANTYEALGQNLQSLENYVTRNQWRMGMRQRWINSAKAAGFNVERFDKNLIPEGDPRGKGLRKMADQIDTWSGFPTASELRWDGFVSGVMEWALNSRFVPLKDKTIVRGANYLRRRNNNPVNLARNMTFHSLLGVANPAQLWVQAQGATLAASLSPAPIEAFRLQNALAVAAKFGEDAAVTKVVANAALADADRLSKMIKLWNKTGLEASIHNTADLSAASEGLGVGREALRRVFDKGLLFYRAGELFNRRYSFITALQRAEKKLGHLDLTDNQLKDVLSDANNMMLNLSRANRSAWQHGVVAIPTQFLQVQAKFLESMTGMSKAFTVRERGRIMAGQLALYGAAGVPLGNLGVRYLQESLGFSQKDVEQLPESVVEGVNNGLWGVFAHSWLGADVDLSNRGAIASGMTEFTLDLMFSEASMGEKVAGAFGTIPHRAFKAWSTIKPMVLNDREDALTDAEVLRGISAIASITSTWSNVQKGYFMHRMHQLNDSRGNIVISNKDFDINTEVMTMLGFQPSELKRVRDRESLVRSSKEHRKQVTDSLVRHYWNYVQALKGTENDEERSRIIQHYTLGTQVLLQSLREGEKQKVREALSKRLETGEDRYSRSIREYIEEFSDGQVLELSNLIEASRTNGLIQNDLEFPEEEEK